MDSALYLLQPYGAVAPATLTAPVRFGEVAGVDGVLLEEGTTNLETNPSFEVDTAGWTASASTLTRSTTRSVTGAASCRVLATGADATALHSLTFAGAGTKTISASVWVPPGASFTSVEISISSFTGLVNVDSTKAATTTRGRWVRVVRTFTVDAGDLVGTLRIIGNGGASGDDFYLDAVQIEEKAYASSYCDGTLGTGYAWTGAAHASTSTRADSILRHAMPSLTGPLTASVLARLVSAATAANSALLQVDDGTAANRVTVVRTSTGYSVGTVVGGVSAGGPAISTTPAVGDVPWVAVTLSGTTATLYLSVNGGPIVSATATLTAALVAPLTRVSVGCDHGNTRPANAALVQLLVYAGALTLDELRGQAFATSPSGFRTDTRIVYAAATQGLRGTYNANTAAGTGRYRAARSIQANEDFTRDLASTGAAQYGATSVYQTTPASGLGVGDLVAYRDAPADVSPQQVLAVQTYPGSGDLVFTAPLAA